MADGDLEDLFALHADPRAFAEDSTDPLSDRDQMRWVLTQWIEGWESHGRGYLSVRARASAQDRNTAQDRNAAHDQGSARARAGGSTLRASPAAPSGLLGVVGLAVLESAGQSLLSAYWRLDPAATGRGVASEAMSAVLTDPRCGPRGREVVAVTAASNLPSRSLAARLGFHPAPAQRPVPGGREGDVLLVRPAS
ncbi:GNAT family N-acetyltransferase [Brachybacterium paraconglomeratum]